jgi:NtrC-family two-component system sensor histidine kinase KinB
MKVGTKLRIGFTIPVVMLLTAGVWSYHRFDTLSRGVDAMLQENDRSVQAANEMILALERMDSGALLHVAGRTAEAANIISEADSSFSRAFLVAEGNITIDTEPAIIDSLRTSHSVFHRCLDALVQEPTFERYRCEVLPAFLEAKHVVGRLRRVNHVEMQHRASLIGRHAYRASLPSVILAMAALLFTVLFAWLTHVHMVGPLERVLNRARDLAEGHESRDCRIDTGDELQELDEALARAQRRMKRLDDRE